jgi:hypothetical protein
MRGPAILIIAAVTFAPHVATAGDVRHERIPDSYAGRWAPDSQVCKDKDKDKAVITLSAKAYANAEANCTVDWVTETASPRGPVYSAHLQCSSRAAPGQKAAANLIIRSEDIDKISAGPDFGNLKIYQRCFPG